jgi:hypothetical protein
MVEKKMEWRRSLMNLTQAIIALTRGATAVVSVLGKRYTAAELAPKQLGQSAVVFNRVGMTEAERKGEWKIA